MRIRLEVVFLQEVKIAVELGIRLEVFFPQEVKERETSTGRFHASLSGLVSEISVSECWS